MKQLVGILLICLAITACKKEPTQWSTDWSAPLIHGQLTLDDFVPQENLTTNSDNYLSIIYSDVVYSFSIDTLIDLPDTTINQKTAINLSSVTVNPAFTYGDVYDQAYNLDEIELKRVIVKEGEIEMEIFNTWPGKTKITFNFPKILDAGVPFLREFYMDPGTLTNPSLATAIVDMKGFDMDLTGVSGNLINTISGDIVVGSNETVNSFDVTNQDSISYNITFRDLVPDYVKGYFGSYNLTDTVGISLPFMDKVLGGTIDIDSLKLNLKVLNGFNLIAQSKITLVKGINTKTNNSVDLNFPDLNNSLNINPASGGMYDYVPSEYPLSINNSNSNVTDFIENLSDSIQLGYELLINPFGNTTGGADEVFPGSTLDLYLDAEFPLSFAADALTLTDTFAFSYTDNSSFSGESATITLDYTNGFPLSASTQLFLLDENDNVINTVQGDSDLLNGIYNAIDYSTTPTSGLVTFTLDAETLQNLGAVKNMAFIVSLSSDNAANVKVQASSLIDFNLRSNLQINLSL
ncbi:MAG: hypothetical protein ABJG68_10185 [Crocinitomicaceae bacterium]